MPSGLEWEIVPDRELTVDNAASTALRAAYAGVITPFEQELKLAVLHPEVYAAKKG
ncbi:hypothetical protein ACIBCO_40580 [Streptomyces violascens]|uniref:hypothetical protein n=1 Tax=Streptomyces violascens TaxID=67381 RepID=UPI0037A55C08